MKKLAQFILMVFLVAIPALSFADGDFRVGVFNGVWCNYPAVFYVQQQESNSWVFHGHILIKSTNQYDSIRIEQLGDNSLYVVRYLTGDHAGQTQSVRTFVPSEFVNRDTGQHYYRFSSKIGYGGCESTTTVIDMYAN